MVIDWELNSLKKTHTSAEMSQSLQENAKYCIILVLKTVDPPAGGLLGFRNIESLIIDVFLSETEKQQFSCRHYLQELMIASQFRNYCYANNICLDKEKNISKYLSAIKKFNWH